jgi:hypothetical protein
MAGHVAEDLRSEAEAVGRYRRLVGTVLRDLREEKGGATGRSVDWQLTGEHRRVSAQQRNGVIASGLAHLVMGPTVSLQPQSSCFLNLVGPAPFDSFKKQEPGRLWSLTCGQNVGLMSLSM